MRAGSVGEISGLVVANILINNSLIVKKEKQEIEVFLSLLRAGLWEKEARLLLYDEVDYEVVLRFAEEQSVVGLVTAGLERIKDDIIPKEVLLQFIGATLHIEQQNCMMNSFLSDLINKLRQNDVYALLVKGQGIAQCYEKPLWRAPGDIDLLLDNNNYEKAKRFLTSIADKVEKEIVSIKHIGIAIDGWEVELHGSLYCRLGKRIDCEIEKAQSRSLGVGEVRAWRLNDTDVFIPSADNDAIFVFTHILRHFFIEGIGLRQVCDWSRLLWKYRLDIDTAKLEQRLKKMGLMSEWRAFAAVAVVYLGMPANAIPFYSEEKKWNKKAKRILSIIVETGNFGHNRDMSYFCNEPYLKRKAISLWRHTVDSYRHFLIFPKDSLRICWLRLIEGIIDVSKGK